VFEYDMRRFLQGSAKVVCSSSSLRRSVTRYRCGVMRRCGAEVLRARDRAVNRMFSVEEVSVKAIR